MKSYHGKKCSSHRGKRFSYNNGVALSREYRRCFHHGHFNDGEARLSRKMIVSKNCYQTDLIKTRLNISRKCPINTITKYSITEELVIGNVPEKESNYDLISVLMLRLGPADEANDKPILRMLDVLLSAETKPDEKKAILEKDFDIPMTKSMSEEANIMCNLGEGIRERTEVNTKTQSIIDLMDTTGKEIDEVMRLLKIDPKEYDKYKENVESMLVLK